MNENLLAWLATLEGDARAFALDCANDRHDAILYNLTLEERYKISDTVLSLRYSVTASQEHDADIVTERDYDKRYAEWLATVEGENTRGYIRKHMYPR